MTNSKPFILFIETGNKFNISNLYKDKCELIFQNTHKRSLNFQNQYFEGKLGFLQEMETFLEHKLLKKITEMETIEFGRKSKVQKKGLIPTDRE